MKRWVLWGFHPLYKGEDGNPYPVRLAIGSERTCNGEANRRTKERGWTLARYRAGVGPTGLQLQCDNAYPNRSHLGESEWCANPLSKCSHEYAIVEQRTEATS